MARKNTIVLSLSILAGLLSFGILVYQELPKSNVSFTPEPAEEEDVAEDLVSYYTQKPLWRDCEGVNPSARCGEIDVPLDWSNPTAGSIEIAVAINPAEDPKSAPYLLMNPGGPGSSGRDWVTEYIDSTGTDRLRGEYNIVGFDPRGVGKSTAVKCLSTKALRDFLYSPSPYDYLSAEDLQYSKTQFQKFADACEKNTGALLANLDTASAARDMDVIRAVLGMKELNYLGYSYGTLLGATYAVLYPDRVGRFVLDGVVDPTTSAEEDSLNQLRGFTSAMEAYLSDCIENEADCPFAGLTVNQAMQKIGKDFLGKLENGSIPTTEGRELSLYAGFTGIIAALYAETSWTYLNQAFTEFFSSDRDGRIFLLLADSYYTYDSDNQEFTSNINEAFRAITCLDSRESEVEAQMLAQNKKALAISPIFGRYWQYGGLSCHGWPYPVKPLPADYSAKGAPTMLVIGTTNDPATPYSQARNFAENVLADAYLLTFKGEGHTAYESSNTCVADVVDDFLIDGKLVGNAKTCN
ncbi:MAG: alpha/beta fold hydrolase [Rhodoluna sp.]